jgi:hypothetical protein
MANQTQTAARILATGRIVIGAALFATPDLAARWIGEDARTAGARVAVRSMGARDAALGAGTLASVRDPAQLRLWLIASSACDAADFVATLAGPPSPARSLILGFAAAGAVAGAVAAASV